MPQHISSVSPSIIARPLDLYRLQCKMEIMKEKLFCTQMPNKHRIIIVAMRLAISRSNKTIQSTSIFGMLYSVHVAKWKWRLDRTKREAQFSNVLIKNIIEYIVDHSINNDKLACKAIHDIIVILVTIYGFVVCRRLLCMAKSLYNSLERKNATIIQNSNILK